MDRREFLKVGGFITVSLAATGTACDGGSTSPFGILPTPTDGGTATTTPDAGAAAPKPATGSAWKFPQSVASGDPKPDGALLWTRVVPATADDVLSASAAGDFTIGLKVTDVDNSASLGTNTALEGAAVVDTTVTVLAAWDHSVRNKVIGLSAGKVYYYQFTAGSVHSNVGRFKTAPANDADNQQLKIALVTCQDYTVNHWAAFETMKGENLDFVLHVGDYIYETVGASFQTGSVEARHANLVLPDGATRPGSDSAKYANTLADYRYLYKKYRSDPRLQAIHERFAFVAIWDDHEFSDDCWGDAETYDNGTYITGIGGDNRHQSDRRMNANQAWLEYMLADATVVPSAPPWKGLVIFRDLRFGKLAHLICTDERLFRSDHIIPEAAPNPSTGNPVGDIGSRYFVPEESLYGVEGRKIAGATSLGVDPLSAVTMLGKTQRDWWKAKMATSTSTWKLWANEVSLLRMGVDGTDAIATLLALASISTLATQIGTTAGSTGGNVAVASAIVAAVTAGAAQADAVDGATAIATADATSQNMVAAAIEAGLFDYEAAIAVAAYQAAKAAQAGGAAAQAGAAAQTIAFGYIKPDIQDNGADSTFVVASGKRAQLLPFFAKFLIDADQWDGYDAERRNLMAHLRSNGIKNVVGLTGDLHAFFTGTVLDDYRNGGSGVPVMVDLVTAGVSSDSFFSYFRDRVGALSEDLAKLVYYPIAVPVTGVGTLNLKFNLFDYTIGKTAPTLDALAEQARIQLRGALAAGGVPEAQLDATTTAVLTGLKASSSFNTSLLGLARQLSALNSNPWLSYVNTDAQGYAIVTVTPTQLTFEMRQMNKLVGSTAPSTDKAIARTTTATLAKDALALSFG